MLKMLEQDANVTGPRDAPLCSYEDLVSTNQQISQIQIEDVVDIENDLEFYQKVPLFFLLGAHSSNSSPQLVLQRLMVFSQTPNGKTDFLLDWARSTANWAPLLVEALSIVRADYVLRRLGLHLGAIKEIFLAHQPDQEYAIHPIVKWLNHICEELTPADTRLLIKGILSKFPEPRYQLRSIPEPTERYLELWFLLWMSEGVIAVGDWVPNVRVHDRRNHCNVDAILGVLKTSESAKLELMHDRLQAAQNRFNCTSQNVIPRDKKKEGYEKEQQLDGVEMGPAQAIGKPAAQLMSSSVAAPQAPEPAGLDGDKYVMRLDRIGYALIINQVNFCVTKRSHAIKKRLQSRDGTNYDKDKLVQTFSNLGYKCLERKNVSADDMEMEITRVANRCQDSDSMVLCILSHGFEGHVYSSDTVAVKITRLEQLMSVPALVQKPKLLIIQACQGDDTQALVPDEGQLVIDGPTDQSIPPKSICTHQLLRADICIAMSTGPGFASYRHTIHGSWFIQTLCHVIDADYKRSHFVDMLTKVCDKVSTKRGDNQEAMITRTSTSLCKRLYFPHGINRI